MSPERALVMCLAGIVIAAVGVWHSIAFLAIVGGAVAGHALAKAEDALFRAHDQEPGT